MNNNIIYIPLERINLFQGDEGKALAESLDLSPKTSARFLDLVENIKGELELLFKLSPFKANRYLLVPIDFTPPYTCTGSDGWIQNGSIRALRLRSPTSEEYDVLLFECIIQPADGGFMELRRP